MLYIGEKVGTGKGPRIDIALDPLEGTSITAKGGSNALTVIAFANAGCFLNAPDVYMDKIAVGGGLREGVVDLDLSPAESQEPGRGQGHCGVGTHRLHPRSPAACRTDQPGARHRRRVSLISDGDVAGIIATTDPATGIDIYMGSGGAPEGVLAAAALRCIGGQMQARLIFRNEDERNRARRLGIEKLDRKYALADLASGDVIFAATGVTDGSLLHGVKRIHGGFKVNSIVMRSQTGTIRRIEAEIRPPVSALAHQV